MFCPKCGTQVAAEAPYCPVCGMPQTPGAPENPALGSAPMVIPRPTIHFEP